MKVLLGLCGSIAAYKSLELARLLIKQGSEVRFVLTHSALKFITPLTCQTLSNNDVYYDQFVLSKGIKHLSLNEWADIFVIAPATANIIGKAACGIGDDLVSTTLLSFRKPVLFVPAMDEGMWENPIVQKNVSLLSDTGFHFLEPSVGALASGKVGRGRFPSVDIIAKKIISIHEKRADLRKKKFLVTGGRTEEDLDPVRVITNRSSGLMAAELMQAIHCRGGDVRGIFGEVACHLPQDMQIKRVRTSDEMLGALRSDYDWCDCLIMAAAVGDYRPKRKNVSKSHDKVIKVDFQKNLDILREITKHKASKVIVGFSLEDKDQLARARKKMETKRLDMIVINSTAAIGAGCATATILAKAGRPKTLKDQTKWELANRIIDECERYLARRG